MASQQTAWEIYRKRVLHSFCVFCGTDDEFLGRCECSSMETLCGVFSSTVVTPVLLNSKPPREPAPIYSYERVNLGDVGYIRRGRFHLLFSAGCPLGSRKLGVDVPRTFEPLDIGRVIYSQPLGPGCLCTSAVKQKGNDGGVSDTSAA